MYFLLFIIYLNLVYIPYIFIPSFYRIRTAFFSFLFSILGSINFILSLFYIISFISLFSILIILPFLIKILTFLFYYWLPEVYCEANTLTTLFLAGLLSKLPLIGSSLFYLIYTILYTIREGVIIKS